MTVDLKDTLDRIHARVFEGFTYTTDEEQYGVMEDWRIPSDVDKVSDDCDGFALACRFLLRQENIPNRLLVCLTETNEWHLVCCVENYILDNRQTKVKTIKQLQRLGYKFRYISGYEKGEAWHEIDRVK